MDGYRARNRAGDADRHDESVRRLISPDVLGTLDRLPPSDIKTTAFWVEDTPVAATCARIDRAGRNAELLSMACLPQFTETEVTTWALEALRSSVESEGADLTFDPTAPLSDAARRSLVGAGLQPEHEWIWFEFTGDAERTAQALWTASLPAHTALAKLTPSGLNRLCAISEGRLSPNDRLDVSPIVFDTNSQPVSYFLLRDGGGQSGIYVQWAWVAPRVRGNRLVAATALVMFGLLRAAGIGAKLRFRVLSRNTPLLTLLRGAGTGSATELGTTSSWRAHPYGGRRAGTNKDDLQ